MAKGRLGQDGEKKAGGDNPRTYRMAFTVKVGYRPFSVEGLTAMRVHFWNWNGRETVVIM